MNQKREYLELLLKKKSEGNSLLLYNPEFIERNDVLPWAISTLNLLKNICGENNHNAILFETSIEEFSDFTVTDSFKNLKILQTLLNLLDSTIDILKIEKNGITELDNNKNTQKEKFKKSIAKSKIFIVHGKSESIKNQVEQFLLSINVEPIILHKQPDLGKTIIEKMEHYSDVSFALILITGDDMLTTITLNDFIGILLQTYSKYKSLPNKQLADAILKVITNNFRKRSRQNVIFEFGYFIGLLGRKKVRAIYEEGVELPSDIQGVLYIPLDKGEKWKKKLVDELKSSELI